LECIDDRILEDFVRTSGNEGSRKILAEVMGGVKSFIVTCSIVSEAAEVMMLIPGQNTNFITR
jgi:hypothetical protein